MTSSVVVLQREARGIVGAPTTFSVDSRNQLTSVGSTTYAYDNNGNVTTETGGAGRTFTYDDENQLTMVGWGSGNYRTEFTYDGRGRMRKKVEKYYSGGQWTVTDTQYYVYDGMRVIQERNSSNVPAVGYTRGNDLSGSLEGAGGIGGLLGRSDTYSGGSFTRHHGYHADGNGNVTALVDSAQASAASYRYNPYGGLLGSSGGMAGANVYRFSSKEWLSSLGLYYFGYRFYDPNLQRWLNKDPLEEWGGINLYGYVGNDPVQGIDPLGEEDKDKKPGFWDWCLTWLPKLGRGAGEAAGVGLGAAECAGEMARLAPSCRDKVRALNSDIDDPYLSPRLSGEAPPVVSPPTNKPPVKPTPVQPPPTNAPPPTRGKGKE